MGHFVKREIERYDDGLNVTYFIHGPNPPKVLIDDIEGCYYFAFGWNSYNERMYFKKDFDVSDMRQRPTKLTVKGRGQNG